MRKGLFLTILLVLLALAKPQSVLAGAFELTVTSGQTSITCQKDQECILEASISAKNTTNKDIYKTTIYKEDPDNILSFQGFNGHLTTSQSQLSSVIPPEAVVHTKVVAHPPRQATGTYQATLSIDGQTCNDDGSSSECYFLGGTNLVFTVAIDAESTPASTLTKIPSVEAKSPSIISTTPAQPTSHPIEAQTNSQASNDSTPLIERIFSLLTAFFQK